jgi:hypothetical protein
MAIAPKKSKLKLAPFSTSCHSTECGNAVLIASTAHAACDALLVAYELVRLQRGRPRGMTTDNEQDLLRSMLVMAAAGLDATVKQLIEDTLPSLIAKDSKSQNSFEKFVLRRLSVDSEPGVPAINNRLLASVLVSGNPQTRLIQEYVLHLTAGSLQSTDSLFEVAAALGADPSAIGLLPGDLRPIFDTRNKIIHELDINLRAHKRTRNLRSQTNMIKATERLFKLANDLVKSVDDRLTSAALSGRVGE